MEATTLTSRSDAHRRGRWLEYLTIGWNAVEALVSVGAGIAAGSTALIGFGVDSAVESASGAALLWRLHDEGAARERLALRLVGDSLLLLAVYVAYEAGSALLGREPPAVSYAGIAIAVLSLVVMPWLARQKRAVAASIGQPGAARRLAPDVDLRLPFGHPARRPGAECPLRLVVGRPCGRAGDGPDHRPRGHRGTPRRALRGRMLSRKVRP